MIRGRSKLAALLFLSVALASCARPPALATNSAGSFELITGPKGDAYLYSISSYEWDDKGQAAGASFEWIAKDAQSRDANAAKRAGEAARSVSSFLHQSREELFNLSTGWFGWRTSTVGQINPGLTHGLASALTPYQGALVGDTTGVVGSSFGDSGTGNFARARSVFAVIDTDAKAGSHFTEESNNRVKSYLRQYAEVSVTGKGMRSDALPLAAALAGVTAGGQRDAGNEEVEARNDQYWVNWLNYELALALGARPGDPDIEAAYFTNDGILLPPDDVPKAQQYFFSGALQNFAQRSGRADAGRDFRELFRTAAGE